MSRYVPGKNYDVVEVNLTYVEVKATHHQVHQSERHDSKAKGPSQVMLVVLSRLSSSIRT